MLLRQGQARALSPSCLPSQDAVALSEALLKTDGLPNRALFEAKRKFHIGVDLSGCAYQVLINPDSQRRGVARTTVSGCRPLVDVA